MLRVSFILYALFLFSSKSPGQSSWRIDKLGVPEGLSEGNVYVIHQDKKGFIWIGTHGGLNRYDGYNFRVFQYKPFDAASLGDNAVFFLKEHPVSGKFWIGGSSCLNEFDPETFTNTRYRYAKKQIEFADGVFINADELLLACEYEVLLFNTRSKVFREIPVYDETNHPVSISRVENTSTDMKGNFMLMSRTGVFFYDPATKSCRRKTASSPDFTRFNQTEIFNIIQDKQNNYWIATNKKGVIRFDDSTNSTATVPLPAPLNNETIRFDVIKQDSAGFIWAGCSNGLFRIDPVTLQSTWFSSGMHSPVELSHPEVNVITEDRNHLMWIGTVGGGINKLQHYHSGFSNFSLAGNKAGLKIGSYIMGLAQLEDEVWFINIWDQVGHMNKNTGKITLLPKPLLPTSYSWYSEGTIIKKNKQELMVVNGEYMFAIHQNPDKAVQAQAYASPGLSHIFHSKNNKTWYMAKAAVEKTFRRNDTIYGNHFFYDAAEDTAGNMWIGTSAGLVRYDMRNNSFTHYRHHDRNLNSVSSDFIYGVEIDNGSQTVWMAAYNGGLCSYHIPSGKFHHYSKQDGLADNIVYAIEKDHHGNLWFSGSAGITTYLVSAGTFYTYGTANGLLNHEFNRRSSFKNDEGWIFFGGISGIDYFHPDSVTKSQSVANLAFTGFRVFDNDVIPLTKEAIPVIHLSYDDRYLSVDFSSLEYRDQQKVQYAYRINNDQWIRLGSQHTVSFSDLPPGEHRLFVRSSTREGVWLSHEIQCIIVADPAWWQTWWFKAAVVLVFIALMLVAIRTYLRRKLEKQKVILEKQQAVEKERTRIATDMHDDLGAGLSRIKFLSETISLKKQKEQSIDDDVSRIRDYAHQMIDSMGEIVWALNEKNDSVSYLLTFIRAYAIEYLTQHHISCTVEMAEEFDDRFVSGEFRRNIFLSVKEILHNIVKHAEADTVVMSIQTGDYLVISVRDNGKGFNPADIRQHANGLANIVKRMKDIGGRAEVNTDKGTSVYLEVLLEK